MLNPQAHKVAFHTTRSHSAYYAAGSWKAASHRAEYPLKRANLLIRSKNSLIRSDSENTDMNATPLGFQGIKVIAWSVSDLNRASRFYGETLGLPPVCEGTDQVGYLLGHTILMLKADWYAGPTELPNPRVIISTDHAPSTEAALQARGVTIPDRVQVNDECYVGSFLDSEGNKLWFCSPVF
jgi:hypothetical protein